MTNVIGLPLARATEILSSEGFLVSALETRSRKGVEGGTDARVLRQTPTGEKGVTLLYAIFRTEPNEANA